VEGTSFLGYESTVGDYGAALSSGFYQDGGQSIVGDVPDGDHPWSHVIASRHGNTGNNYQLQVGSSYATNDRLFFRKIAQGDTASSNPGWNEVATRGGNTFSGNQTIFGAVGIGVSPSVALDVAGEIRASGAVTVSGELRLGSRTTRTGCPSFWALFGNVCYSGWNSPASFINAQANCYAQGAHVCTYAEFAYRWLPPFNSSPGFLNGDMIGDLTGDDQVLCVNNASDINNFEGHCNKADSRWYMCCIRGAD
jgi:hypothetical protein